MDGIAMLGNIFTLGAGPPSRAPSSHFLDGNNGPSFRLEVVHL
jgi:hypothetical protein